MCVGTRVFPRFGRPTQERPVEGSPLEPRWEADLRGRDLASSVRARVHRPVETGEGRLGLQPRPPGVSLPPGLPEARDPVESLCEVRQGLVEREEGHIRDNGARPWAGPQPNQELAVGACQIPSARAIRGECRDPGQVCSTTIAFPPRIPGSGTEPRHGRWPTRPPAVVGSPASVNGRLPARPSARCGVRSRASTIPADTRSIETPPSPTSRPHRTERVELVGGVTSIGWEAAETKRSGG